MTQASGRSGQGRPDDGEPDGRTDGGPAVPGGPPAGQPDGSTPLDRLRATFGPGFVLSGPGVASVGLPAAQAAPAAVPAPAPSDDDVTTADEASAVPPAPAVEQPAVEGPAVETLAVEPSAVESSAAAPRADEPLSVEPVGVGSSVEPPVVVPTVQPAPVAPEAVRDVPAEVAPGPAAPLRLEELAPPATAASGTAGTTPTIDPAPDRGPLMAAVRDPQPEWTTRLDPVALPATVPAAVPSAVPTGRLERPATPAGRRPMEDFAPAAARTSGRVQPLPLPAAAPTGKVHLRRIDPFSVLKTALLLAFGFFIAGVVAVYVFYEVLNKVGVFTSLETTLSPVDPNATIANALKPGNFLPVTALVMAAVALLGVAVAVLLSMLYNLAASFTGGVRVTLGDRRG